MSGPSYTSVKLARAIVYCAQQPELAPLLPTGCGEKTQDVMRAAGLLRPWMLRLFGSRVCRRYVDFLERKTIPGQLVHFCLRKRFFDEACRAAIRRGATQVLNLGAGLDPLCARLAPQYPDVLFAEIDLPGTIEAKRAALSRLGAADGGNLELIGADLAVRSLGGVLAEIKRWDPKAMAVVLAEGLVMYLSRSALADLLDAIVDSVGPGSEFVFSYLAGDSAGRPTFGRRGRILIGLLRLCGATLRWGARPGELERLLAAHGFNCQSAWIEPQTTYLDAPERQTMRYPPFEWMARATRTD